MTTTTEYLPIVDVTTYDGHHYVYACGLWGSREQASESIARERSECEGNLNSHYCETREITTDDKDTAKLSKTQFDMMMMIGPAPSGRFENHDWHNSKQIDSYKGMRVMKLRGSHQHRTAYALEKRGIARVFCSQQLGGYAVALPFTSK